MKATTEENRLQFRWTETWKGNAKLNDCYLQCCALGAPLVPVIPINSLQQVAFNYRVLSRSLGPSIHGSHTREGHLPQTPLISWLTSSPSNGYILDLYLISSEGFFFLSLRNTKFFPRKQMLKIHIWFKLAS